MYMRVFADDYGFLGISMEKRRISTKQNLQKQRKLEQRYNDRLQGIDKLGVGSTVLRLLAAEIILFS